MPAAKKSRTTDEKTNALRPPAGASGGGGGTAAAPASASAQKKPAAPKTEYFLYDKQLAPFLRQIPAYLVCKTRNSEGIHYQRLALCNSQYAEIKTGLCLSKKYIDLLAKNPILDRDSRLPLTYKLNQKEYPIEYKCISLMKHAQGHTDNPKHIRYNPPSKYDTVAEEQARNGSGGGAAAPATPTAPIPQNLIMAAVMLKIGFDQFRLVFLMVNNSPLNKPKTRQEENALFTHMKGALTAGHEIIARSDYLSNKEIKERTKNPEKFWNTDLWQPKAAATTTGIANAKPSDEDIVQIFFKNP